MKNLSVLAVVLLLAACASGSAIIVGQSRPTIEDWTTVVITTEMPERAEKIALVKATSLGGATKQGRVNYAIDELKQQAAKAGANTVVLGASSTEKKITGVPMYGGASGPFITTSEQEAVEGIAVYVER